MQRLPSPHAITHALAVASLLLAPAAGWAAPGPQAGVSAAVRGSVLLAEVGHPDVVGLAVADGDAVYLGNAIKAGPSAGMQLMLLDQTTVTLGENAELAVDEFIYDPAQNTGQISMNLTKGAFRLVTGGVSDINPANTRVRTPTATIGVRGTIVLANVSESGTLIALGGPGPNADSRDRVGAVDVNTPQGSVSLTRPGFATFVAPGQAPETPRPLTPEESASLSGGLARDGGSSGSSGESSGGGSGGSTSEEGATQATEASGTRTSEGAAAATVVTTQSTSTSTAADQTASNTQSSDYGNEGSQLASNSVVQQYLAAPDDGPPPPQFPPVQLSWAEALQARGAAYTIARAADLAGLSGTASYTRLGAPLFDISGLDEEARNRLWLTSDFSGLTQVGSYDFSARIDFGLRRAYANWTRIKMPGDDSYYTLADDTGDELPALLAYDENEEPVYRVEGETTVPTRYFARVRGAFISGTGDPNAAPGRVIQGLGIYVRNGAGGVTPLYGGGGRADKDVKILPPPVVDTPEEQPVEPWPPHITAADFSFIPSIAGGTPSSWAALGAITQGSLTYRGNNFPIFYRDNASQPWTLDPTSHYGVIATIDFATRQFNFGLTGLVLNGTPDIEYAPYSLLFGAEDNDAGYSIIDETGYWGPAGTRSSLKVSVFTDPSRAELGGLASILATELFLGTPSRLYRGTGQMTGVYDPGPPPAVQTFDSSMLQARLDNPTGVSEMLSYLASFSATINQANLPLEYSTTGRNSGWTAGGGTYDFYANLNFDSKLFDVEFSNINLNDGSTYNYPYAYDFNGVSDGDVAFGVENDPWSGPSGSRLSWRVSVGGSERGNDAWAIAHDLFIATEGKSFRGTAKDEGAWVTNNMPLAINPYDVGGNAGQWQFSKRSNSILSAYGITRVGIYGYTATVDFNLRTFNQSVQGITIAEAGLVGASAQAPQVNLPQSIAVNDQAPFTQDVPISLGDGSDSAYRAGFTGAVIFKANGAAPAPEISFGMAINQGGVPVYKGGSFTVAGTEAP